MPAEIHSLLIEPQTPIDADVWESYQNITSIGDDISSRLLPDAATVTAEKEAFYRDMRGYEPNLRPRSLDETTLDEQESTLLEAKADLADSAAPDDVKQLYSWRINERVGNARMLRAAYRDDTTRFRHYDGFVYGRPDQDVFGAVNDWFYRDASSKLQHDDPEVRQAAGRVMDLVGEHRGDVSRIIPSDEVFTAVRQQHFSPQGFYALLLSGIELPAAGPITAQVADPILRKALDNIGSDLPIHDAPGMAWSIRRAEPAAVLRPAKLNMGLERFIGLGLGHEIGSHELEAQNGKRLAIQLAASGFDRYEVGNEGRAVVREQVAYSDFEEFAKTMRWQDILRRHFATGVAHGLMGGDGAYPQVYEAVHAVDVLYEQSKKAGSDATAKAHSRSWKLLELIQKGTDGSGGAYSRYQIYLEGVSAVWQAAALQPSSIDMGDLGKFDITNDRHMAPLIQHGIVSAQGTASVNGMVG